MVDPRLESAPTKLSAASSRGRGVTLASHLLAPAQLAGYAMIDSMMGMASAVVG